LEISAIIVNIGSTDRLIRLILASVFLYLGLFLYSGTGFGIALVVMGGLMLVTGLVGFCGFYQLLGIRTTAIDKLN